MFLYYDVGLANIVSQKLPNIEFHNRKNNNNKLKVCCKLSRSHPTGIYFYDFGDSDLPISVSK